GSATAVRQSGGIWCSAVSCFSPPKQSSRIGFRGCSIVEREPSMSHRAELVEIIRQIRNRWRLRLALRGGGVVGAGRILCVLVSASGVEAVKFGPRAALA